MDYFALQTQDLSQGFLKKIRIDLATDLETFAMKFQSLSPTISSNLTHLFK